MFVVCCSRKTKARLKGNIRPIVIYATLAYVAFQQLHLPQTNIRLRIRVQQKCRMLTDKSGPSERIYRELSELIRLPQSRISLQFKKYWA